MTHFPQYVVEGVILKRKNIGESDRIVTMFTKEFGKLYGIAKGIRKINSRRAPHLEVFTHARIVLYKGKKWDTITEVQMIQSYTRLRLILKTVASAYYIVEIIDKLLPEKQEHRDIFVLLTDTLSKLNIQTSEIQHICDEFSHTVLVKLGYLQKGRTLDRSGLERYIESIIERKLQSSKFIHQLN